MLQQLWYSYSHIGLDKNTNHPDKRNIILGNHVVFFISLAVLAAAIILAYLQVYRAVALLSTILVFFFVFAVFIYKKQHYWGRFLGIIAQNLCVFLHAVFLGYETRIIDFLIISSLMPLLLFNIGQIRTIIFCVSQNILLYLAYHIFAAQLMPLGLPQEQQLLIYTLTVPIKFIIILLTIYIIIKKRKDEEAMQKQMIGDLERVNTGLKQFAYVTSHDLKTPLRNISTYLQLLKRKNTLDSESNEMVDNAVASVKHLNQLISDIFLYTTTDFKNEKNELTDLNELMATIQNDLKAILVEQRVQLLLPDTMPAIRTNHVQAMHVFSNLISNAIKYNRAHIPVIKVTYTRLNNGFIEFRITDNGIGIPTEYQEQIFEIFKRLHTQEEFEGTGIGLAICKKIVESYGGEIRVDSYLDKGATFIFTLPG